MAKSNTPIYANDTMPAMPMSDFEEMIRKLEQGTDLLKLYLKRKPERTIVCVRLETREILIRKPVAGRSWIEGSGM